MPPKRYILKNDSVDHKSSVDFSKSLNASQIQVVKHADDNCLVLAGAGSGKTRTLIYRVLYLIEKGVKPQNILLVTFTNKAAHEMRSRVEQYLGAELKGLWCGTFHHIGHRILRKFAKEADISESFGILDEEDSRTLIKSCYTLLPFKPSEAHFPQANVLQKMMSYATNVNMSLEKVLETRYPYFLHFEMEIKLIIEEYQKKKRATDNLDFDDLLVRWIQLMNESEGIREKLTQQFQYCLVDEYQDINALQNQVIEIMSEKHQNLLVVGDDAQSIYSFRGAEVKNILEFPERHSDVKIFKLETNYRSTPQILRLANASIQNNTGQFHKELESVRDSYVKPQLSKVKDTRDQASFVAQRILELIDEGVDVTDVAVLFRARYQAAELELELSRRRIPYILRGGVRFFEQAHIKDVICYLRIVDNPSDEIAWQRALLQFPGVGSVSAKKIFDTYQEHRNRNTEPRAILKEMLENSAKRMRTGLAGFAKIMDKLFDVEMQEHPDLMIQHVLDQGYIKIMETRFDNAKDRVEDLQELANFAHTYEVLSAFLNDIALRENFRGESFVEGAQQDEDIPLVLSTIHQAKGLEWRVVFVLGLNEGQFPHHQSAADEAALEEERRLFYVAATRAKDELILVQPMTRFDREQGTVLTRISPFLMELPSDCYETLEVVQESKEPIWDFEEDTIAIDE